MQICIIHLSDIHFGDNDDALITRADKISAATQEEIVFADACFVVVTGDIAWSGTTEQYAIAQTFLNRLTDNIKKLAPSLLAEIVIVPGNHDCNFNRHDRVRNLSIEDAKQTLIEEGVKDLSIVDAIVKVQDEFFNFLATVEAQPSLIGVNRLYYERFFKIGNHTIRFDCYNIAWLSQLHETPSQLFFPVHLAKPEKDGDLVIALLHHPTQWIDPNNARELRDHLDSTAHFVFSGHEHVPDGSTKERTFHKTTTHYVEAPAFQANDTENLGFNFVQIDLIKEAHKVSAYKLNELTYKPEKHGGWTPTKSSEKNGKVKFHNNKNWRRIINDPGAPFSHPHKTTPLILSDLYIYPDLDLRIAGEGRTGDLFETIRSRDVIKFILETPLLTITGDSYSGKTSLWRSVYPQFQQHGKIPVMLKGGGIKTATPKKILKLIHENFVEQYSEDSLLSFRQADIADKVIIIDDFHQCRLTAANKVAFLEAIQKVCGHLVIFANPTFLLEEISMEKEENTSSLLSFTRASIKEFGYLLRDQIINKWYRLGKNSVADEEEIQYQCRQASNFIKAIRETNSVPSYPIFILMMLQSIEAGQNLKTNGEYGYFYEQLIFQKLSAKETPQISIDLLKNYIPYLAWHVYNSGKDYLTADEFDRVTKQYMDKYTLDFSLIQMEEILIGSVVLRGDRGSGYRFVYRHTYYYFAAKYLANHVNRAREKRKTRNRLSNLVKQLQAEENANIILFYLYLTQDEATINQIIGQARTLYQNNAPCRLDHEIHFINKLPVNLPRPALPKAPPHEIREKRFEMLDRHEEAIFPPAPVTVDIADEEKQELDNDLNEFIEMNKATKTIQVLGQALRNFPGGLSGDFKETIAEECYLLSLRTMSMILGLLEKSSQELFSIFVSNLQQAGHEGNSESALVQPDLAKRAEELIYFLTMGITAFLLRHVSTSVGSEILKPTYSALEKKHSDNLAVKLIDLAIKLDFFQHCPIGEIEGIEPLTKKNDFARNLLRLFVIEHFSMNDTPIQQKQRVCDLLEIRHNLPQLRMTNKQ